MRTFTTYQDLEKNGGSNIAAFVLECIRIHNSSKEVQLARIADLYDRQRNKTINEYVQTIFSITGQSIENFTASNNKIASNFFESLNTQRVTYSLGNGVQFNGEDTRKALGDSFDEDIYDAAYYGLKHGVGFIMWNFDRTYVFPLTEFVPMYDEETGALRAGIRFWRLAADRPLQAVLYEEDGYTTFKAKSKDDSTLEMTEEKRSYKQTVSYTAYDAPEVIGEENYSMLPIVPVWGSRTKQSTIIGLREAIDSYDLIKSGFANDVTDCAQIYWLVENYGGMTQAELEKFRDRMLLNHIVEADTSHGGKITPYVQEVPYEAREALLEELRIGMYRDFGALDVNAISATAKTATEIRAAYQPVDAKAADFERQLTKAIRQLLNIVGIEDEPTFLRDKVANDKEEAEIVLMEAAYLDDETVLKKLPNISPEEIANVLAKRDAEALERMERMPFMSQGEENAEDE